MGSTDERCNQKPSQNGTGWLGRFLSKIGWLYTGLDILYPSKQNRYNKQVQICRLALVAPWYLNHAHCWEKYLIRSEKNDMRSPNGDYSLSLHYIRRISMLVIHPCSSRLQNSVGHIYVRAEYKPHGTPIGKSSSNPPTSWGLGKCPMGMSFLIGNQAS